MNWSSSLYYMTLAERIPIATIQYASVACKSVPFYAQHDTNIVPLHFGIGVCGIFPENQNFHFSLRLWCNRATFRHSACSQRFHYRVHFVITNVAHVIASNCMHFHWHSTHMEELWATQWIEYIIFFCSSIPYSCFNSSFITTFTYSLPLPSTLPSQPSTAITTSGSLPLPPPSPVLPTSPLFHYLHLSFFEWRALGFRVDLPILWAVLLSIFPCHRYRRHRCYRSFGCVLRLSSFLIYLIVRNARHHKCRANRSRT